MTCNPADGPMSYVDTAQMVEVDRAMIEDYHIELIQMMENAGRNLAHPLARAFWAGIHAASESLQWREAEEMAVARSSPRAGSITGAQRSLSLWGSRLRR